MNKRHWRRFCALFLAAAILITGIPFQSAAKENTVEMIIRGDAFQNRPINIFGHSHRSITCYYVNPVEGHVPAFCRMIGQLFSGLLPSARKKAAQSYGVILYPV